MGVEIGVWGNDVLCRVGVTSSWRGVTVCEMMHEERGERNDARRARRNKGAQRSKMLVQRNQKLVRVRKCASCSVGILADFVVRRLVL